ncbi:hypothetical protein [Streptomyces sp. NPDC127190]|uniref:hypothetical protein n=1 Tax=unclassified Streptomyces TaxID=2593676 RepID=UPI003625E96D
MESSPACPRPSGEPRWVALFHRPARGSGDGSWSVGAQSPYRAPVLYAVGDMTRTLRARGEQVTVALWGPREGAWHRYDAQATAAHRSGPPAPASAPAPARFAERMAGRRHQVLVAGLAKAGLYELGPEDEAAVRALADRLDEPTVRRVAHWLSAAGGER